MQCLDDRLSELEGAVSALTRADANIVIHAGEIVSTPAPIARCRDERSLRSVEPPPALAKTLQPVRDRLARANVLLGADRFGEAQRELDAIGGEVPWPPLEALHQFLAGSIESVAGHADKSLDHFYSSLAAAERGRDDQAATRASILIARADAQLLGRTDEALRVLEVAHAMGGRSGDLDEYRKLELLIKADVLTMTGRAKEALPVIEEVLALERREGLSELAIAKALVSYGNVLGMSGRLAEAVHAHREVLAFAEKSFGADHPNTCTAVVDVGYDELLLGHAEAALPLFDRALATRQRTLRPDNPMIASVLTNRAGAYDALTRYREGLADAERAVAILGALAPQNVTLVEPLNYAARAQLGLGQARLALALAERGLAITRAHQSDPADAAGARYLVARALVESGGDRRRAAVLFDEARSAFAKLARDLGGQYVAQLAELDDWRARHPF
jgi:tetratricopeptide (TPR) repeat protein